MIFPKWLMSDFLVSPSCRKSLETTANHRKPPQITDNRITRIIEEALTKGIHIRIISDNTKSEDRGSDLDRLRGSGIECRFDKTSAHMHHKFAISDNDLLLNGSYNWTRSASTENNENILVSNNAKLVQSFQNEFNRLWDSLS